VGPPKPHDAAALEGKWSLDCRYAFGKQSGLAHSHLTHAQRSANEALDLNVKREWIKRQALSLE